MKKIFVLFVCILTMVVFLSSAWAVDRVPQSNSSDAKEKPTKIKRIEEKKGRKVKHKTGSFSEKIIRGSETTEKVAPKKSEKSEGLSGTKKSKERYDYFIDRNNNGIDDRLEKDIKAKQVREQEVIKKKTAVPSEKAPAKVSPPPKAPKKVRATKTDEPKKETKARRTDEERGKDRK